MSQKAQNEEFTYDIFKEFTGQTEQTDQVERVTTKQAAHELNMDVDTLQYLLQHRKLPIGYAVKKEGKKRTNYYIYRGLLNQYKRQLSGF